MVGHAPAEHKTSGGHYPTIPVVQSHPDANQVGAGTGVTEARDRPRARPQRPSGRSRMAQLLGPAPSGPKSCLGMDRRLRPLGGGPHPSIHTQADKTGHTRG